MTAQVCPTLCNPMDCSSPALLSMEFPRQEYWSGLPFPSPEDLQNPEIEPVSPDWKVDSFPGSHLGSPRECYILLLIFSLKSLWCIKILLNL